MKKTTLRREEIKIKIEEKENDGRYRDERDKDRGSHRGSSRESDEERYEDEGHAGRETKRRQSTETSDRAMFKGEIRAYKESIIVPDPDNIASCPISKFEDDEHELDIEEDGRREEKPTVRDKERDEDMLWPWEKGPGAVPVVKKERKEGGTRDKDHFVRERDKESEWDREPGERGRDRDRGSPRERDDRVSGRSKRDDLFESEEDRDDLDKLYRGEKERGTRETYWDRGRGGRDRDSGTFPRKGWQRKSCKRSRP